MPTAASAGIGAVGSIAGGIVSGKGAKKAAKIQAKSAAEQMALLKKMYADNVTMFTPEMNSGNAAVNQINALLGLTPMSNEAFNNGGTAPAFSTTEDQWAQGALDSLAGEVNPSIFARVNSITDPSDRLRALEPLLQKVDRQVYGAYSGANPRPTDPGPQTTAPVDPNAPTAAQTATDIIRATPGYQFQVDEAMKALNANAYASGLGNSGATFKALLARGQQLGDLYFNNYVGQLGDVAARGGSAKSSISGVSQNFTNNSNQVNQNAANNAAGYQVKKSEILSDMINSVAKAGGSMFGSSYGSGAASGGAGASGLTGLVSGLSSLGSIIKYPGG